jgi:hypothetical protein
MSAHYVVAAASADGETTEGCPFRESKKSKLRPSSLSLSSAATVQSMLSTVPKSAIREVFGLVPHMGRFMVSHPRGLDERKSFGVKLLGNEGLRNYHVLLLLHMQQRT